MGHADSVAAELPGRHHILGMAGEEEALGGKGLNREPDRFRAEGDLLPAPWSPLRPNDLPKEALQLRLFQFALGDAGLGLGQGGQVCPANSWKSSPLAG